MPMDAPTMDVLRKQAIAMAMLWFTARDYQTEGGHAFFHIRARDLGLKDSTLPGMKIAVRIDFEPDTSGVTASDATLPEAERREAIAAALMRFGGYDKHSARVIAGNLMWAKENGIALAPAPSSEGDEGSGGVKGEAAPNAWRVTALAFERRAMRVEYVIRLLVAAGHVTQQKVDEAFSLAKNYAPTIEADVDGGKGKAPKCPRCGGEGTIDQTGYGEYRPCPECNPESPYYEYPSPTSPPNGKTADGVPACPTCRGEGEVDERIGGDPFAANVATCPDCNGTGNAAVDASRGGEHG